MVRYFKRLMNVPRRFKIAAGVLLAAVLTAAGLEWNAHDIIKDHDPTCRRLTKGEVALARGVFGDTIRYDDVRIFDRTYMLVLKDDTVIAPNGHIYAARTYCADFSKSAEGRREDFLHEMTHVWQHHNGRNVRWQALREWVRHGFDYSAAYHCQDIGTPIFRTVDFKTLGIEQQAQLVEAWYRQNRKAVANKDLVLLEDIIRPHLPLAGSILKREKEIRLTAF